MSDSEAAHALSELLGGLCKTDDDRAILAALCEAVEEVGDEWMDANKDRVNGWLGL